MATREDHIASVIASEAKLALLPRVSVQRLYQRAEKVEPAPNEVCVKCHRPYDEHEFTTETCPVYTVFQASGRFYPPKQ